MKHKKTKHKTTVALILIALITSITGTVFLVNNTIASPDFPSFDAWRPTMTSCGCHVGVTNTKGSGSISFASSKGTVIAPGEAFDLILDVQGFVEAANEGVSLGLNKLDADNTLFTGGSTVAEVNHMLDANGDSVTSATFALTAPSTEGIYTLKAYAVEADSSLNWVWTEGVFVLSVKTPKSPLSMTYMDVALGAADYLLSVAVVENGGYKWAEANGTVKYQTGFIKGAAGTGYYFLDLYRALINEPHLRGITNNPYQYLDVAKGAAQWLIDVAVAADGGYKWPEDFANATPSSVNRTGFYYGAAGIGTFFLSMYQATGNATYLNYAEGAARWLIAQANTTVGYAWGESEGATALSTRWTFGAPGIGGFFLQLYQATGNATYRTVAEGAATWLKSVAEADGGGYKWQQREDGIYLLGRWHGAMGVASFFLDMYEALGNVDDLAYAEGAARWVISEAVASNGGYKWENYIGSNEYIRGWTRGPAGIGAVFYRLGEITSNATYTAYGDGSAEFLINDAISEDGGYVWVDSNINPRKATAMGHGSAGIGLFFLQAFRQTGNIKYYASAMKTAIWLNATAIRNSSLAWYKSSLENNTIHTTLYYGVSGVGTFFLDLAELRFTLDETGPTISNPYQDPPGAITQPDIITEIQPGQDVTVQANITDAITGVDVAILSYSTDNGTTWTNISMQILSGSTYTATIPTSNLPIDTKVLYRIIAYDKAGNSAETPQMGMSYQLLIIPEFSNLTVLILAFLTLLIVAVVVTRHHKKKLSNRPSITSTR